MRLFFSKVAVGFLTLLVTCLPSYGAIAVLAADPGAPVIILTGSATVNLLVGDTYNEEGAIADDDVDPDFAATIGGDVVNTATPATYVVTYNAQDSEGNDADEVTRTVTVAAPAPVDTTAPVITLNGSTPVTVIQNQIYTEPGAVAEDDVDPNFLATVGGDVVDTTVIGTYVVTYDAVDVAGNFATQVTRTVDVVADQAPVVTLDGSNPQVITKNQPYNELGATATDDLDDAATVTANIIVDASAVVTSAVGSYNVIYTVTDSAGNTTVETRTVDVVDLAPVIALNGSATVDVEVNTVYVDAGATASDDVDGDLTSAILLTGSVDTSVLGSNVLTYEVTDSNSATTQATRTVNVVDDTAPVITLDGVTADIVFNGTYTELGATATDNFDGTFAAIPSGAVNTSAVGSYVITYTATDAAGNMATPVTRTVNVIDVTAPFLSLIGLTPDIEVGGVYLELGASATDDVDGIFAATPAGAVNTNMVGAYTITYSASDAAGNTATPVTRTVNVVDTTAPVIHLTGLGTINIGTGDTYTEQGAIAVDNYDVDSAATIGGDTVDTSVPNTFTITYNATDTNGNNAVEVTRTVIITDDDAPVIILNGSADVTVFTGDTYTELGAVADDNVDADFAATVGGDVVDETVPGIYMVTYDAVDAAGNVSLQTVRTVTVVDDDAPVITLNGAATVNLGTGDVYTEDGAGVTDNVDTGLVAMVGGDVVNTAFPGMYIVTFDAADTAGNSALQITREVTVTDDDAPTIALTGSAVLNLGTGDTYVEEGAVVSDNVDPDFAATVGGDVVDTSIPGVYVITYNAADAAGNVAAQITRDVVITDDDAPVTTLIGSPVMNLGTGDTYTEEGAIASDNVDGDFAATVGGDVVDTAVPGTYAVTYDATDFAGNVATQITRTVTVTDDDAPVITLNGNAIATLVVTNSYTDLGATAIDNVDGTVTANIVTVNPVNTGTVGSYIVTYNVTDAAGNVASQVTRTVIVNAPAGGGGGGASFVSVPTNSPLTVTNIQEGNTQFSFGNNTTVTLNVPAGGVNTQTFFTITATTPASSDVPPTGELQGGKIFTISAVDTNNTAVHEFAKDLKITFALPGVGAPGATVAVYYLNETTRTWILIPGVTVTADSVTVPVNHLTQFAVVRIPSKGTINPTSGAPLQQVLGSKVENIDELVVTLRVGSRGDNVKRMQETLKALGYLPKTVVATGYYGTLTAEAVRKYRATAAAPTPTVKGVKVASIDELIGKVSFGTRSEEVRTLQSELQKLGYFPRMTVTTYFGPITKQAVEKYLAVSVQ